MNAGEQAPPPSPFARSVGAAAAGVVISLFVLGFTYLLRAVDFAPLRWLIVTEDRAYDVLHAPEIHLLNNAHRVVFIDIDDDAAQKWSTPPNGGPQSPEKAKPRNNTPRGLIAELTNLARNASAAVIFLDFDFRDPLTDDRGDGDRRLYAELAKKSDTPVLIPSFFTAGRLPPCDDQNDQFAPAELETVFDDLTKGGQTGSGKELPAVALVHPVLALGAYGLTESACSAYRVQFGGEIVSREAAMVRAVELATAVSLPCAPADQCIKLPDLAAPEIVPIRWTIANDTEQKHDSGGNSANNNDPNDKASNADVKKKLAYARIKASSLVKYQNLVDSPGIDLSILKGAIVVIGSTARWSEDTLSTPLGDLQGALAHVNLALSLESSSNEFSLPAQFSLDVGFIIVAALVTIPLCWLPTFKSVAGNARLPMRQRLLRMFRETCVIAGCGFVFAVVSWRLSLHGSVLSGWRFGILTFVIGTIVVLLIEICSVVSDGTQEAVENLVTRRLAPNPKTSPQPEPSTGNAAESTPP
jgi:CHASE2 domain-containing sensor protein